MRPDEVMKWCEDTERILMNYKQEYPEGPIGEVRHFISVAKVRLLMGTWNL